METDTWIFDVYGDSSTSEDDDSSTISSSVNSDQEEVYDIELAKPTKRSNRKRVSVEAGPPKDDAQLPNNLVQKLFNRERTGNFAGMTRSSNCFQRAFNKVPNRLKFCLKDFVPSSTLQGHMFMGLTACGQFLLSYKVILNESLPTNPLYFNTNYRYSLYFWIYQPHVPMTKFYRCCIFDDHGVDNLKEVTIVQWKHSDSRVLIVHGAAEDEHDDSYITYIKVPKLGCLDCKKLYHSEDTYYTRYYALCLKCSLVCHTKYASAESDRKFDAYTNLICPDRILIAANGFLHMLHMDLELLTSSTAAAVTNVNIQSTHSVVVQNNNTFSSNSTPTHDSTINDRRFVSTIAEETADGDNGTHNIVARILADFSDIETDSTHSNASGSRATEMQRSSSSANESSANNALSVTRKTYDELVFTCNSAPSAGSSASVVGLTGSGKSSSIVSPKNGASTRVSLFNHQGKRHHRIVTKSYRNGVTTVDMQDSLPSSSTALDKSNAYEFSEDNEKCEKIATLRKRRLAEKKYEFSEDNSENIVPFTKIRSASRSMGTSLFNTSSNNTHALRSSIHRPSTASHYFHNSPCPSPSSSPHPSHASSSGCDSRHCTPPPIQRASPIALQGFRSPPYNSGIMRSPSRHVAGTAQIYTQKSPTPLLSQATQQMLSFKPLGTLSPLQVSMTKRGHLERGSMSPSASVPFLSPRREENRVVEIPLQGGAMPEKPICTKKFKRRYVEEDEAASVITSEEDDCISPGYHTSLPMEVHGSCYSQMEMISQASYQQLRCASVVITQHSFDLEAFTYYVISMLCQKNQKSYDVFYDWACELITVCPLSQLIMCVLMAQFSARDHLPAATNCLKCFHKLDCSCTFNLRQFECRILFTWNMETGEWEVLDFGELIEINLSCSALANDLKKPERILTLTQRVRKLAHEMASSLNKIQDYSSNLRVLKSKITKSKTSITDNDNMIEFYLKRKNDTDLSEVE